MNKTKIFEKEINYIINDRYRENLQILINLLPDYFFEIAASSSGKYHPLYALGEGGLVRHTKAAVKIAYELLKNNTIGNEFSSDEKDLIIISLILHDGLKRGIENDAHTSFEHPILMSIFIMQNKSKLSFKGDEIELITSMIGSHMGEWTTNKYSEIILPCPITKYEKFVHMCDYLASRKFININFEKDNIID